MLQTKRIIVFLFGCILARIVLVFLAKNMGKEYLKNMGYIAILVGLSFWYLYIIGNADRKSTRLNSSHVSESRMPSSA